MYLVGQGHDHFGPGTSMVQRINWTTGQEQQISGMGCFPGAEMSSDCMAHAGTSAEGEMRGLGCAKCGGGCGRECGLGLFDTGFTDFASWGWPEYVVAAFGGYALLSMMFTTKRAARRVREFPGDVRAGVKRGRKRLARRVAGE